MIAPSVFGEPWEIFNAPASYTDMYRASVLPHMDICPGFCCKTRTSVLVKTPSQRKTFPLLPELPACNLMLRYRGLVNCRNACSFLHVQGLIFTIN